MRGTGLPGCARARASTWANPPVRCRDGNNHWDDYMTDKYKYRGQIRGRVCGGPEGGVRQIHVCQRGHLRRPVEGGTETWTGDVHLEGEERKVGHSIKQWPSSHVYPFPFSSFSSTHFLYLSLYQGDCHQQYVNLLSCQFKLKSSLLGRSHPTQYKQSCLGHCTCT